ncbi:MAG: MFS transporter [Haloplanus sp.]
MTPPDTARVPWRSRTVQVVLLSTALAPLGVPLVSPALPAFRDAFGLTDAQASLLVSGYFVVGVFLSPFIGLLADRIGRKRVLVAGLVTFGLLGGAIAVAPSFPVVLALRVGQGTGAAAIFITTVTLVGDSYEGTQRAAVLGVNVAVLSAAAAVFPVVGGVLVTVAWNAPFLTYLAALPVALFAAVALDEPRRTAGERGLAYLGAALRTVTTPPTMALFGATFLTEFLAFGVVFTALPFLLAPAVSPVAIGAVLLTAKVVSVFTSAATGRLSRSFSPGRLVALGFAGYAVGFAGAWAASASPVATAVAVVFVGAGVGVLLPNVDAAVTARVPPAYRAGALSLRNSTTFLGRATGPVVFVGLAVTAGVGYTRLLLAAGVVAAVASAAAAVLSR